MGFKHKIILGVILIWSSCISQDIATELNNVTIENTLEDANYRNNNLIEKLTQIDLDGKDVHSSIPDSTTKKDNLTNNTVTDTISSDITNISKSTLLPKKDNAIKKLEKGREDNGRSIDIEKYVSSEFHNNVFTIPNFPETEKYFDVKLSTEKPSFSDFDLTTPKSDFFDNKFKEVSEELRQKLEHGYDDNQSENDHDSDDGNEHEDLHENDDDDNEDDDEMHVDKVLEEPKISPNATLDYKELKNIIVKNNTDGKAHNDFTVEKLKRVNFVSNFNDTRSYDYDSKDDIPFTFPKNDISTTKKPVGLTKPPSNENNSDILNNKIETGTIKAILSTTEFIATKRSTDVEPVSSESPYQISQPNVSTTVPPLNLTSQSAEQSLTSSNPDGVTIKVESTTVYEDTTSTDQITTVKNPSIEPSTGKPMTNDSFTTEFLELPTTILSDESVQVTDETTIHEQIIEDTTVGSTSTESNADTTTTLANTETTTNVQTTEQTTNTSQLLTEDAQIIITTKRAEHEPVITVKLSLDRNESLMTSSVTAAITTTAATTTTTAATTTTTAATTTTTAATTTTTAATTTATTTAEKPDTTFKPNTLTTTSNTPEVTTRPDTTVPPISMITTTEEFAFRNDIQTDEFTEPVYGTETSISTPLPIGGDDSKNAVVIGISTVGAICLILLAGLLYVMRKRQKRFNYKQRCRPVSLDDYSVDNVSAFNSVRRKGADRHSKRSYGNPAFEDPSAPSHPLNFPALAKFASNIEDIKSEFDEIPQITAKTSELPDGCEPKNRYANVIPLPETRVNLRPIDGYPNSDYINANYVTGPNKNKGFYIACQAPMQNTVDDFWRMIWEQQCKVILMVTHFFENGVEKCVDYLPPSEVLDCHRLFGDFQVTLKKRDVKEKYVISSLQLKNMVSNSWREVTHFWYLGWPEKGIPSEANSLIAFLIEARSYMKSTLDRNAVANGSNIPPRTDVNPVVVHCSPGTGRTGVVLACDIAIREFEQTRLVDIPKIVYMIRRDRANAVQTKEQYIFIYKVVSLYATKLTGGALESL